jgi:uncharacterized membrane protein HdeD (DUF308 family)
VPPRDRDPESIRRAPGRNGEDPFTGLSWWWMLVPGGVAVGVAAVVFLDALVAVAVVAAVVVLGGLALLGDEWLGDDWS